MRAAPVQPASQREGRRSYRWWLGAILVLGWALRLLIWQQQSRSGVVPTLGDEEEYYRGAIALLKGWQVYDGGQWLRAPMPSVALAACLSLARLDLPLALALQSLIAGLAVLPIAATARSYWASDRAGLVAGLLSAVYVPYVLSASQMMSEPLAVLLIALTIWCLERWRVHGAQRWLFAAGLALGLFTLTRATGLYAQALVLGWIALRWRWSRRTLGAAAAFGLGCWLVIAPWAIRNTLTYGQLVLVDTNAGFSFWSGTDDPEDHLAVQVRLNTTLTNSAQRQSIYFQRGLANIRHDPAAWLREMRSKLVALWQLRVRVLIANGLYSLVPALNSVPLALAGDALYLIVLLSTLAGLFFVQVRPPHWFLLGWPLYGSAMTMVSLGHPRLRIPLEVSLLVLGAFGLAHPRRLARAIWNGARWRQAGALGALVLLTLLLYSSVYPRFAISQTYLALARLAEMRGNPSAARTAAEAAVRAQPQSAAALLERARLQHAADDPEAQATLEQVLALDGTVIQAHALLLDDALHREDAPAISQRMAAIAALRYDDNRLYDWLWQRAARRPRPALDIGGSDDLGLIRGFSEPQHQAGTAFRWTITDAAIRLPGGPATMLHLRLRDWRDDGLVQLRMNNQVIGSCRVARAWRECRLPLAAQDQPRVVQIDRAIDVPWPPTSYQPQGIAVARVWID